MAPKSLADLIGKLNKSTKKLATSETEEEAEEGETEQAETEEDAADEAEPAEDEDHANGESTTFGEEASDGDIVRIVHDRAEAWAQKAVKEAKLVSLPRSDVDSVVR